MLKNAYIFSGRGYTEAGNYNAIKLCRFLPHNIRNYTLDPKNRRVPGVKFALVIELHTDHFRVYSIDKNAIKSYENKGYTHYRNIKKNVLTIQ